MEDHLQDAQSNFTKIIDDGSNVPHNNLNTYNYEQSSSMDSQHTTSLSYSPQYNLTISRHRYQRQLRLRHIIDTNNTLVTHLPLQTTTNSFTNQFFNGSPF